MGICYFALMCQHVGNTAYCMIPTAQEHHALACGSDYLDTMYIEARIGIVAGISYANTGALAHIDDENQAMIDLFEIG